ITVALYLLKLNYEYWEKRGVPGPKPKFIVGNLAQTFLGKKSPTEIFCDVYNDYPDLPFVGVYHTGTPSLVIRDPDLIKEMTVKSFDSFHDNFLKIDKDVDPLFGKNPFFLRGEDWKIIRNQLSPAFTSGKMKWLYPHLEDVGQNLAKFVAKQPGALNGQGYEAKELCMRFTLNNVASCAFGVEGKCFEEDNSEFRQIADKFMTPNSWSLFKLFLVILFPVISKFVSIKFAAKEMEDKITNMVSQTLKYREENKIIRNDFLHNMNQLKKTCKEYEFTDVDVTAHAAGFIIDGYETSSIVMSFLLYELAANPDVQSKLREEIVQRFEENNDRLPYDVLQAMPYLDGVMNESLRMHSPGFALQKLCTKSYSYVPEDDDAIIRPVVIEKGTPIILPLYGLHYDPKYFEEPQSFKPERFIGANKEKIRKYTHLPFGEGPRSCLGQRFASLQIKTGVAYIIKNYELTVNKKTKCSCNCFVSVEVELSILGKTRRTRTKTEVFGRKYRIYFLLQEIVSGNIFPNLQRIQTFPISWDLQGVHSVSVDLRSRTNQRDMSEQLVKFIERQPQALNGEGYEAKELCIRFTLNNVACCAFGLEGKCFEEENSEFRQMAKEFLTPGTWKSILFFIAFVVPILTKIISLKFVKKEVEQKLKNIVSQTLKYREENNIIRNDFLHILQQLKKTCREYEFTDVDVTAHAAGFFGDGSETTSIVMSFLLFELAANPEVQSKLREEISQHSKENGSKLSYEVIQSLPYLDGVVNGNDGIAKPVVIEKGTTIILPLYGLHHDPQYFENPETFTPERFVGANKENLTKYAFLPFGEGPRACLGKRFGILQVKVGVAYIIQNYEISVNKKTKVPIQYDPLSFLASAVGGLWLDFKRIK
ncbi:p450 domain containing protein, partial [Asbolus verrucosus]